MRFFRSEAALYQWQQERSVTQGEVLTVDQMWALANAWYHDRLSPAYRSRTVAQVEAIFRALGLTSSFWYMAQPHQEVPQK
jgi:Alkylmercury lyase